MSQSPRAKAPSHDEYDDDDDDDDDDDLTSAEMHIGPKRLNEIFNAKLIEISKKKRSAHSVHSANTLRMIFGRFNAAKDGVLQKTEFRAMLKNYITRASAEDCDALFDRLDTDHDGGLDVEEFGCMTHLKAQIDCAMVGNVGNEHAIIKKDKNIGGGIQPFTSASIGSDTLLNLMNQKLLVISRTSAKGVPSANVLKVSSFDLFCMLGLLASSITKTLTNRSVLEIFPAPRHQRRRPFVFGRVQANAACARLAIRVSGRRRWAVPEVGQR
jgi:hypothetical protein